MDILVIRAIVAELQKPLTGSRIDKIVEEAGGSLTLHLRGKGINHHLLISANPAVPRMHLTSRQSIPTERPSPFQHFLKSRLTGGRIVSVLQEGIDRIVRVDIETGGPFEAKRISLIIELLGKSANMIAVDGEDIILACLRPTPPDEKHRGVLLGLRYVPPPPQSGIPFDKVEQPVPLGEIAGLSPALKKELLSLAGSEDPAALLEPVIELRNFTFQPVVYPADEAHKAVLSAIPLKSLGGRVFTSFPSMNEAADTFYAEKGITSRNIIENRLGQAIRRYLEKVRQTEAMVKQERASWVDAQSDMIRGQTLLAWKDKVPKRASAVELAGPDGAPLHIALDPDLSVTANAERYFKRCKKARRGVDACTERLGRLAAEVEYLEGMLTAVDTADDPRDLVIIEEELCREGYLKLKGTAKKGKKKEPSFQPRKIFLAEWEVWVGRSAGDNDNLLRHASADDLWFHAHGVPGSHVVIRNPNRREIPEDIIHQAAGLAARHSRARNEGKVDVVYCPRKFVRKPPGAKPGLVTISEFRTITVIPG